MISIPHLHPHSHLEQVGPVDSVVHGQVPLDDPVVREMVVPVLSAPRQQVLAQAQVLIQVQVQGLGIHWRVVP